MVKQRQNVFLDLRCGKDVFMIADVTRLSEEYTSKIIFIALNILGFDSVTIHNGVKNG